MKWLYLLLQKITPDEFGIGTPSKINIQTHLHFVELVSVVVSDPSNIEGSIHS